jgi:molybdopterin synthase catalytic subunit
MKRCEICGEEEALFNVCEKCIKRVCSNNPLFKKEEVKLEEVTNDTKNA